MAKGLVKILGSLGVAIALAGLFAFNYQKTHPKLEESKKQYEKMIYSHPDKRTTHLLNFIAGKEKLTEEDLLIEYRKFMKESYQKNKINPNADLDNASIDDLDKLFINLTHNIYSDRSTQPGDLKDMFYLELNRFNNIDTTLYKPSKNLYELVWSMEKECGNPRIRFASEDLFFAPIMSFQGASHYKPINNTLYVKPSGLTIRNGAFISEMSHALQFNQNQTGTYLKFCKETLINLFGSKFNLQELENRYDKSYHTHGKIEYEAHQIIEPYLKNKYKLFTTVK